MFTVRGCQLDDFIEAWQKQSKKPNVYAGCYGVTDFDESAIVRDGAVAPGVPQYRSPKREVNQFG
jgi:hypothetical protein